MQSSFRLNVDVIAKLSGRLWVDALLLRDLRGGVDAETVEVWAEGGGASGLCVVLTFGSGTA